MIVDWRLPDDFGSDISKRLKEIKPDVKVIYTRGLGKTQVGDSMESGCNGFLRKPFKIDEMSKKLKNILGDA